MNEDYWWKLFWGMLLAITLFCGGSFFCDAMNVSDAPNTEARE